MYGFHQIQDQKKDLTMLLYSTYLGGDRWDGGIGIEFNNRNNTVGIVGYTGSNNFPTTNGAYIPNSIGSIDGFALLIDNESYQVTACTYLGTPKQDIAMRLAYDCSNNFCCRKDYG
jgi:hypothetical protein